MVDDKRLMIFRMLSEYAEMQGLDLRDLDNTSISDDVWRFGFFFENEKKNPHFIFYWQYLTESPFTSVYRVIRVFEENCSIINSLPYKHNFKKEIPDGNDYTVEKGKTTMMNYSLLELLKEEQSVIMHIEKMKQEEKEVCADLEAFTLNMSDDSHTPTVESRKLLSVLERRQRIVMAELQALDEELRMVRNKITEYMTCQLGLQMI